MAFSARMRARWQRLKRCWSAPTLISSSQCTHWCIDCCADQLETFCLGEPNERNFVEPQIQRPCQPQFPRPNASISFSFRETFSFGSEMLSDIVLKVLCELQWQQLCFCSGGVSILLRFHPQLKPCSTKDVNRKKHLSQAWKAFPLLSVNSTWCAELWI